MSTYRKANFHRIFGRLAVVVVVVVVAAAAAAVHCFWRTVTKIKSSMQLLYGAKSTRVQSVNMTAVI